MCSLGMKKISGYISGFYLNHFVLLSVDFDSITCYKWVMKTYQDILETEFNRRTNSNPSYSLRAFANQIGINHGALSQILSGKRVPSYKIMQKILIELELDEEQLSRFESSIVEAHKDRAPKRMNPYFKQILNSEKTSATNIRNIETERLDSIHSMSDRRTDPFTSIMFDRIILIVSNY